MKKSLEKIKGLPTYSSLPLIISVIFLIISLISQVTSHPYNDPLGSTGGQNLNLDPTFDPNINILETLAATLPSESFNGDPFLLQKLDTLNSITKYIDISADEEHPKTIFERQVLDKNKEVVVLTAEDDLRHVNENLGVAKKRTYIVLRRLDPPPEEQSLQQKTVLYRITYAYIREARPTDKTSDLIPLPSGKSITVEWDTFDNRPSTSTTFHIGWPNCAYTLLFTCTMNQTAVELRIDHETLKGITEQVSLSNSDPISRSTSIELDTIEDITNPIPTEPYTPLDESVEQRPDYQLNPVQVIEPISTEVGFDPTEYSDLYGDFDITSPANNAGGRNIFSGIFMPIQRSFCSGFSLFGGGGVCNQPGKRVTKIIKNTYAGETVQGAQSIQSQTAYGYPGGYPGATGYPAAGFPAGGDPYNLAGGGYPGGQGWPGYGPGPDPNNPYPSPPNGGPPGPPPDRGGFVGQITSNQIVTNTVDRSKVSNANTVYGIFYPGIEGTPDIFLPDASQTPALFVPDSNGNRVQSNFQLHGYYVPGVAGHPDTFIPDDPAVAANMGSFTGTMVFDAMTITSTIGGIHGSLADNSFRPDKLGSAMWFNHDSEQSKKTWTPPKEKSTEVPIRPKTTPNGDLITYGVYFPGVSGSPDIFIPDGEGLPGYFVPNDPSKPDVYAIPHGVFTATKPAGHGSFITENSKELLSVQKVRGAFMPDGMSLAGAIAGLITRDVSNTWVFVVDVPGQEFSYFKGKTETQGMWTPFLRPGEWTAPTTTTPAPPVVATPAPGAVEKAKVINPSFVFGIKFPGLSSMDIFIPDDYPVPGQMLPEDSKIKPIKGELIVSKLPGSAFIFRATSVQIISTLSAKTTAMFIPEGITPGNGIMGELVPDSTRQNCTYQTEPPGKGYWYIKDKPENNNVWTPFLPPWVAPPPSKATVIDKIQSQPLLTGYYVPGIPGTEPVFIPEEGAVGCFIPDEAYRTRSCGTYYPEKPGSPSEFVQDIPNTLQNNVKGNFIPQLVNGMESISRFHATFISGPPGNFILDKPSFQGWSHSDIKVSTKTRTTTSTSTSSTFSKHTLNRPIEVGGGFVGYPTNNKGIDALVDPNNPIFKEFLEWKSRQDKSIGENDKIVILNSNQIVSSYNYSQTQSSTTYNAGNINGYNQQGFNNGGAQGAGAAKAQLGTNQRTSFVSLEEYKKYLEERYTIKTTNIKTSNMNEMVELAVPKAAEKYVKKKKQAMRINVNVNSKSYAGAGSGSGSGGGGGSGSGSGGASGSGSGLGGVGGKCGNNWSTSSSATAMAQNGSNAHSDAHAINGGDAKAISLAKDGANADSNANTLYGGKANAKTQSKNRSNGSSTANALYGGVANALSQTSKDGSNGESLANAKRIGEQIRDGCDSRGMPEEIEVDSHAAATALNNGTGGGGNIVNSIANTNVKIDMGSLMAKIMEMQQKQTEMGEYDEDSPPYEININTNSHSDASGAAQRGRGFGSQQKSRVVTRAGWKTEYKIVEPNCTLQHEDQIFFGLGSCPFINDLDLRFAATNDPEQFINYYLRVLRVDCLDKVKVRVMSLFNDGFLRLATTQDHGHHLQIPNENQVKLKAKITDTEMQKLSAAIELSIFTQTYSRKLKTSSNNQLTPYTTINNGPNASRSVRFLSEFALNFVKAARDLSPRHYVRLTRNMLSTIRTLLIKLYQDGDALGACPACTLDTEMNQRDKLRVVALLEFLIHGLGPFEKSPEPKGIFKAFAEFLKINQLKFQARVEEYRKQFQQVSETNLPPPKSNIGTNGWENVEPTEPDVKDIWLDLNDDKFNAGNNNFENSMENSPEEIPAFQKSSGRKFKPRQRSSRKFQNKQGRKHSRRFQ